MLFILLFALVSAQTAGTDALRVSFRGAIRPADAVRQLILVPAGSDCGNRAPILVDVAEDGRFSAPDLAACTYDVALHGPVTADDELDITIDRLESADLVLHSPAGEHEDLVAESGVTTTWRVAIAAFLPARLIGIEAEVTGETGPSGGANLQAAPGPQLRLEVRARGSRTPDTDGGLQ